MEEGTDFRSRRENFMKGIQLTNAGSVNGRVSYIGDRIRRGTPEQEAKHRKLRQAADYYFSLPEEERLEIQRKQMRAQNSGKRTKRKVKGARTEKEKYEGSKNKLLNVIATIAFSGLAISTLVAANKVSALSSQKQDKSFDALTQNQDTLEMLGISRETVAEIEEIDNIISSGELSNYSDEELLKLGERIASLQLDTIKGKLANELGVTEDNILVTPDYNDGAPKGVVKVTTEEGEMVYNREGDLLDDKNNISTEISDYIVNIANTQTANSRLEDGVADRDDVIEQYTSAIGKTKDFATKEVVKDDNGNISLNIVPYQDIDELIQNDGKTQDIDDGDER